MSMLLTGSVSSVPRREDGLRLLVTRFRGRGLSADAYDVWMANLGPSEALLRSFLDGTVAWNEFGRSYRDEMFAPSSIDDRNETIRNRGQLHSMRLIKHLAEAGPVTLLCHCHGDATECHRFLLRDLILSKKV